MDNSPSPFTEEESAANRRDGAQVALVIAGGTSMLLAGLIAEPPASFAAVLFGLVFASIALVSLRSGVRVRRRTAAAQERAQRGVRPVAGQQRAGLERALLETAADNDGYVTPEALVLHCEGVTIGEAAALLDELAAAGRCESEVGEQGHLFYRFQLGRTPERDRLAPDEWVERMTGERAGESQSSDA